VLSLDLLLNAIVAGILIGGFYAAVSLGISVSFGLLDIVNIAHPGVPARALEASADVEPGRVAVRGGAAADGDVASGVVYVNGVRAVDRRGVLWPVLTLGKKAQERRKERHPNLLLAG